jgi:excisionase family DNA binding protein
MQSESKGFVSSIQYCFDALGLEVCVVTLETLEQKIDELCRAVRELTATVKESATAPAPQLLSKKHAALALSVSVRTIDRMIAQRQLHPRRIGDRVLFHRSEIQRFTRSDHPSSRGAGAKQ